MRNLLHKSLVALAAAVMFSFSVNAQQADIPFDDLPPAVYGKCYAKCKIADQYETVSSQKLVKEASTKLTKVPAVFESVTEQVLAKEGRVEYMTVPATYRTVTEEVEVVPASTKMITVPAKYTTESREVLVSEARGEWVKKKKSPSCFSKNPDDCYIVCFEEIPAVYRTETYQVLVSAATTREETIPAKYKTVSRKVVDQPARVEEKAIPATYKTLTKRVMVSPETVTEETIPAIYKSVNDRKLVSTGGYTVWTEILCPSQRSDSKISAVQNALNKAGYSCGTADGVLGLRTQTALKQYQTDKGLAIGNLSIETLQSLGVQN